jgi:hypothetical protein
LARVEEKLAGFLPKVLREMQVEKEGVSSVKEQIEL